MSWQPELDDLEKRKALARQMGGPEKIKRHHDNGKLTVRERVDHFLDPGTFQEIGSLTGSGQYDAQGKLVDFTPANQIMGKGTVDGRPVIVYGDDFTVRGGAADGAIKEKVYYPEHMANAMRLPLVRLIDGTGGGGSAKKLDKVGYANLPGSSRWDVVFDNLCTVPVVALALGSVAGIGAARVAAAHYSLMVKGTSQIFVAGPPLVAALGQQVTKEELGGSQIHARNGTVDDEVNSEAEAFEQARRFLSYMPRSVDEYPPRKIVGDDPHRRDDKLLAIVPKDPRKVYQMRSIINSVVDQDSFFEIGKLWGRSMITGFARLDGWPVALIAEDPYHYAGAWTKSSCEKLIRFIDLAETFHFPVVHLVDCPGFAIGVEHEKNSTIRLGVRAMAAVTQTTIPWCSVIVRKVFGVAGGGHRPAGRFTPRYAWPSGTWGSIPFAGGVEVAYKAEIAASDNPADKTAEIKRRLEAIGLPFRSAENFIVEEIIDPRDTRRYLCDFANLAVSLPKLGQSRLQYRP